MIVCSGCGLYPVGVTHDCAADIYSSAPGPEQAFPFRIAPCSVCGIARPNRMDAVGGPVCHCGKASAHECGECADCGRSR